MIGLSGAHRSGKSTLAQAWSEQTGMPRLFVSTSAVIARKGWECKDIRDPLVRIDVQAALVEECDRVFQGQREPFISDRTPLDYAAYLLADLGQDRLPLDQEQRALDLIEDCIDITNACFGGIILLMPVLPYVHVPGTPLENRAYQWHIHTLIAGLCADDRMDRPFWHIKRDNLDMESRLASVQVVYDALIEDTEILAEVASFH